LISLKSKKLSIVSRSSSEVEYRVMASTTCEIQWLTYLLSDLKLNFHKPGLLFYNNNSSMHIAKNSVFHERTKHIEIDCHTVRVKLEKGVITLLPVNTHQ
jgi:hypothetical protein